MSQHTQNLDEYGLDLLASMVALEPHKRISCRMAMQHPYFDDLDKTKLAKDYWRKWEPIALGDYVNKHHIAITNDIERY